MSTTATSSPSTTASTMKKSSMKRLDSIDSTDSDMDSSQNRSLYKHVYFGDVQIHEFPLIMGDNPYCRGAPLQLGWKPTKSETIDIDIYEFTHGPRRSKKKFHMADVDREIYLLSIGYGLEDIIDVCEQGRKIRKDRYNSFHAKKWDRFRVVMESAKEKLTPANKQNVVSAKTA